MNRYYATGYSAASRKSDSCTIESYVVEVIVINFHLLDKSHDGLSILMRGLYLLTWPIRLSIRNSFHFVPFHIE